MGKAAIYHFTDKGDKHPKVYLDVIDRLRTLAEDNGYTEVEVYCDKSLRLCDRTEFSRFMENAGKYDALITKDFYHIRKNTKECFSVINDLNSKGIRVLTLENGEFNYDDAPSEERLNAATYTCRLGQCHEHQQTLKVRNDILRLYIDKKTSWKCLSQFSDESRRQNDGEQINLRRLIDEKDAYQILVVHKFSDLHWRTSNFCRIRKELGVDILSLQEGFLRI